MGLLDPEVIALDPLLQVFRDVVHRGAPIMEVGHGAALQALWGSDGHVQNGGCATSSAICARAGGLNFTDTPPRGKPLAVKVAAVLLDG